MAIEIPRELEVTIFRRTPQEKTVKVDILGATKMMTFPTITKPTEVVSVTYSYSLYPPSIVEVPALGFTIERLKEEIERDLETVIAGEEKFII